MAERKPMTVQEISRALVGLVVVGAIGYGYCSYEPPPPETAEAREERERKELADAAARKERCARMDAAGEKLIGDILQDIREREAYVTPLWYLSNVDDKKLVAEWLYSCKGIDEIKDFRTDKVIAGYDSLRGPYISEE